MILIPKYVLEEWKKGEWHRVGDVMDTSTRVGKVAYKTARALLKRAGVKTRKNNRLRKLEKKK